MGQVLGILSSVAGAVAGDGDGAVGVSVVAVGTVGRRAQRELERAGCALELVWRIWAAFLSCRIWVMVVGWRLQVGSWLARRPEVQTRPV